MPPPFLSLYSEIALDWGLRWALQGEGVVLPDQVEVDTHRQDPGDVVPGVLGVPKASRSWRNGFRRREGVHKTGELWVDSSMQRRRRREVRAAGEHGGE